VAERNLKDHLRHYYGGQNPPRELASRLEQAAESPADSPVPVRSDRTAPPSGRPDVRARALIGCMIALVLIVLGLFQRVSRLEGELAELRRLAPASAPATGSAPAGDARLASTDQPNLVAVFVHADWCPRCPIVGPVYREVATKYAADDVLFVKLDITDQAARHQTSLLGEVLDIKWLPKNQRQSGMVTLIDRKNKTVLATLTDRAELDRLETTLNEALRHSKE
jgi:thiol-disulfide isomerase/thioredoxin